MAGPAVSIITPYLNAAPWLSATIESVRAQRFADWELLLIDDGSSDGSAAIAARYAAADTRIRLLPPNPGRRGAAAARNRGIAAAQGDCLCFLDADDLYRPEKLAHDIAALDVDSAAAWVFSASRWHYEDGSQRDWTDRFGLRLDRSYDGRAVLIHTILKQRGDCPGTCGVMIRRSAIAAAGGFEERFELYEDQSLWVKLLLASPVHIRSGCDAIYRQHAASTSARAVVEGKYDQYGPHPARVAFLEWVSAICRERHAGAKVEVALSRALEVCRNPRAVRLRRLARRVSRYLPLVP